MISLLLYILTFVCFLAEGTKLNNWPSIEDSSFHGYGGLTFLKLVRTPPILEDESILALDPEAAAVAAAASAKYYASVQADAEEKASIAAFAERRVRRADRWRLRERGNSHFITSSTRSLASLSPLLYLELEGGIDAIVAMNAVHSEDSGVSAAKITLQRRLADNGVGDATEDVEEQPVYGRTYWVSILTKHSNLVTDLNNKTNPSDSLFNIVVRHKLVVSIGVPHNEPSVYSHTFARTDTDSITTSPSSSSTSSSASLSAFANLRMVSYNTWNSNPPKWLWHDGRDRMRQYSLRLFRLGDVIRQVSPHIIAFQEVRYDSSLGGFDKGWDGDRGALRADDDDLTLINSTDTSGPSGAVLRPENDQVGDAIVAYEGAIDAEHSCVIPSTDHRANPYDFKLSWSLSNLWHNKTSLFAFSDKYKQRNVQRWEGVVKANGWIAHGRTHPLEGEIILEKKDTSIASISVTSDAILTDISSQTDAASLNESVTTLSQKQSITAKCPYTTHPPQRGVPSVCKLQRATLRSPHAQVEHLAAHFPGYQYVFSPGQLYLDRSLWLQSQHRDEEGPAIFSRFPIIESESYLLSRNSSDEGDSHQRLCLHAVIDASEIIESVLDNGNKDTSSSSSSSSSSSRRLLVDVYTVHLSLSEASRNRTVLEIRSFIKRTSKGSLILLAGDMNAEPHEPAIQALTDGLFPNSISSEDGLLRQDSDLKLRDVWLGSQHAPPEPTPRDPDQAVRRYAFTFPSDDPVKRIDLVFASLKSTTGEPLCGTSPQIHFNTSNSCIFVEEAYVIGQDATPGTEMGSGGMLTAQSAIFASDHRGVATHLRVPVL
jgi:endonuclease/exonuclease/phosphatase family metal-dependent hydrolase